MGSDSVQQLVAALHSEDQEVREQAAAGVVDRYFAQMARAALRRLNKDVRVRVDGEDVAQSALGSFFRRVNEGGLAIKDADSLTRLLFDFTKKKALKAVRRERAGIRSVLQTEHPQQRHDDGDDSQWEPTLCYMQTHLPSEEDGAELKRLLELLDDERLFDLAVLILEGHTIVEIASRLGVADETIRAWKRKIARKWKSQLESDNR